MIRTVIESPFGRNVDGSKCTPAEYARNVRYLNRALEHSIAMGDEAPYASHRFYPGLLDDTNAEHRALGMKMGLVWSEVAQKVAVYQDHGVTPGMRAALAQHRERGIIVVFRSIGAEPELSAGFVETCNCPDSKRLAAELAAVTAERDRLLTGRQ